MVDAFVRLFLGHLFGDFVLQNSWIAINKVKNKYVLLLHTFIVFLSHLIFVLGKGFNVVALFLVSLIWIAHHITDSTKIRSPKFKREKAWIGFVLDQLIHIVVIFGIASVFPKMDFFIPFKVSVIGIAIITNAYLYSILAHLVFKPCKPYRRDIFGYFYRGIMPIIFEISVIFSVVIFLSLPFVVFLYRDKRKEEILSGILSIVTTTILGVIV